MMKRAIVGLLMAAVAGGCSSGPRTFARGSSEAKDDYVCRQLMQKPGATSFHGVPYKSYQDCREDQIYVGELLAAAVPAQQAAPVSYGGYTPPPDVAPAPLPNILPQTTRCQSVPSGLGTVQTICR